jgi:hypothetical protein
VVMLVLVLMLIVPWLSVLLFCSDVFVVPFLFSFGIVIGFGAIQHKTCYRTVLTLSSGFCFVVLLLLC